MIYDYSILFLLNYDYLRGVTIIKSIISNYNIYEYLAVFSLILKSQYKITKHGFRFINMNQIRRE